MVYLSTLYLCYRLFPRSRCERLLVWDHREQLIEQAVLWDQAACARNVRDPPRLPRCLELLDFACH